MRLCGRNGGPHGYKLEAEIGGGGKGGDGNSIEKVDYTLRLDGAAYGKVDYALRPL